MHQFVLQRHPLSGRALVGLVILLIMPVLAAIQVAGTIPGYLVPGVFCAFSFWVYFIMRYDKKNSQTNQWRVPEAKMHLGELLGGWPGSFIAQRRFRHKISKKSYQFTFWLIVFFYQAIAFDCLMNWKYSRLTVELASKI